MNPTTLEARRLSLQAELDARKTPVERNRLGQFATPTRLARDVVALGLSYLAKDEPVAFLDPAIGTGSFYAALRVTVGSRPIAIAVGVELDPHYREPSQRLWGAEALTMRAGDFTTMRPDRTFNLIICNPPYVRHHHLAPEDKERLVRLSSEAAMTKVSGLAGLYVHFMLLSQRWMAPGGVAVWLVPSEFMDVNYGRALKTSLRERVTLLRVHRADPQALEFSDALVSSAVVVLRNTPPPRGHHVVFSFGGTVTHPAIAASVALSELASTPKWTRYPAEAGRPAASSTSRIGDLFEVKRGIATGDNGFFMVNERRLRELGVPVSAVKPILPSPRRVKVDEILGDASGVPTNVERLFLLDTALRGDELQHTFPALWAYFRSGEETTARGYLCSRRSPWYAQEQRPPAPIVSTYMGRGDPTSRPFRFIRNRSRAIAANVYLLLYPKKGVTLGEEALDSVWQYLNALDAGTLLREGRVYGGGLYKLEPAELAAVPIPEAILGLSPLGPPPEGAQRSRQRPSGFLQRTPGIRAKSASAVATTPPKRMA